MRWLLVTKISNAELRNMTMAYAISMWHKRVSHDIRTPVRIDVNHIRHRFPTPIWAKRITGAFTDLVDTHPHFTFDDHGNLEYFPHQE